MNILKMNHVYQISMDHSHAPNPVKNECKNKVKTAAVSTRHSNMHITIHTKCIKSK